MADFVDEEEGPNGEELVAIDILTTQRGRICGFIVTKNLKEIEKRREMVEWIKENKVELLERMQLEREEVDRRTKEKMERIKVKKEEKIEELREWLEEERRIQDENWELQKKIWEAEKVGIREE